ncbi:MAG TPA: LysR substrate-binding domain-containing protein [Williamwhitmania sp.]|nr:LysR substrate-binding domain-containing protein [Williamwhitmania sp.]
MSYYDFRWQVFMAVAQQLSFTRAAEQLYVTQPAVSKHIRELELLMGVSLFQRKANRVELTQAGELVKSRLMQVFKIYGEMEYELGLLKNTISGELRIAASSTIAQYVLPEYLSRFYEQYPHLRVSIVSGNSREVEELLEMNRADIGMVEGSSSRSGLVYLPFLDDELIAVASPSYAATLPQKLSVGDLLSIPLVVREAGSGTLEVIDRVLQEQAVRVDQLNVVLQLGTTEGIKQFLEHASCIGIVSKKSVEKELERGTLFAVPLKEISFKREFRIVLHSSQPAGSTALFLKDLLPTYNL